ncbi:MAG: glycosyltransferase family 9 protein [Acidobacteriota bacterium]
MALKVLLFQIGSIGDTVMSIPAFRAVQAHFGEGAEYWVLYDRQAHLAYSAADVLQAVGGIQEFLPYPASGSWLGKREAGLKALVRLRAHQFNAVVYLAPSQRSPRSVRRDRLFFRMAGIPNLLGFHAFEKAELAPEESDGHPAAVPSEAWWRLERLKRDGVEIDAEALLTPPCLKPRPEATARVRPWLAEHRRHPERPLVAIAPGSKQPVNLWPLDRFISLGRNLIGSNAAELVVVGGQAEQAAGEACINAWGQGLSAAGRFSVGETLALLSECALLVGLDTGTTHLAAAAGVPCVALYSDKDSPGRWYPLGANHAVIRKKVPCGGCRLIHDPCPIPGHPCIESITVDEVIAACQRRLQELSQAPGPS